MRLPTPLDLVGHALVAAGVLIVLWHASDALRALDLLYAGTSAEPLDGPDPDADAMRESVRRGAIGVPFVVVGTVVVRVGRARRRRAGA